MTRGLTLRFISIEKIAHNARIRLQTSSRMFLARTRLRKARKVVLFLQVRFHGNKGAAILTRYSAILTRYGIIIILATFHLDWHWKNLSRLRRALAIQL